MPATLFPRTANLLEATAANFETGVTRWQSRDNSSTARVADASAFEGSFLFRTTSTALATVFSCQTDGVPISPGVTYTWRTMVKAPMGTTIDPFIEFFVNGVSSGPAVGNAAVTATGNWQVVPITFTKHNVGGPLVARIVIQCTAVAAHTVGTIFDVDQSSLHDGTSTAYFAPAGGIYPSTTTFPVEHDKAALLTDDFVATDTNKWTYDNAVVDVGQLRIDIRSPMSNVLSGITAKNLYDLRDSAVYVEVPQHMVGGDATVTRLLVEDSLNPTTAYIQFGVEHTNFVARIQRNGANEVAGAVVHNPTNQRWWRIRHFTDVNGNKFIAWETSLDGVTYSNFSTTNAPGWLDRAQIRFLAGTTDAIKATTAAARIDNFNTTGPATQNVSPTGIGSAEAVGSPTITVGDIPRQEPEAIAGLVARFRADTIAQAHLSAVSSWTSSIGTSTATQSDAAKQPVYDSSGVGGHPEVLFDGATSDYLNLSGDVLSYSNGLVGQTVIIVARLNSLTNVERTIFYASQGAGANARTTVGKAALNSHRAGGRRLDTDGFQSVAGVNDTIGTTSFTYTAAYSYNNATLTTYRNGTQYNTGAFQTAGSVSPTNSQIGAIGANPATAAGAEFWSGAISEILVYNRVLTANERAHVNSYIQDRYGITVADYVAPAGGATQTITPTGIDSAESVGSPTLGLGAVQVSPTGFTDPGAVGTPTLGLGAITVSPTGIADTGGVGSPTLGLGAVQVSPTGFTDPGAVGSPSLGLGAVAISPQGINDGENVGSPTLGLGAITVSPVGIASQESVGTPALTVGADPSPTIAISPAGIGSAESVGSPTISTRIAVSPVGIGSAESVGTPSLTANVTISLTGIPSMENVGQPTLTASIQVSPNGIAGAEAVGEPTLGLGALAITPTGIASQESVGTPSLTVLEVQPSLIVISPVGINTHARKKLIYLFD